MSRRIDACQLTFPHAYLTAHAALHGVRHPGDDPGRPGARRDQPGAGFPGLPGAGSPEGSGRPGDLLRHQPVRDHVGREAAARSGRREVLRLVRDGREPGDRGHGHLRRHGSHGLDAAGDRGPGRRGHRLRTILRELRPGHAAVRSRARVCAHVGQGRPRPGPPRGRLLGPDARHRAQYPEQPHRPGRVAPRPRGYRRPLPAPRRLRGHGRDLRAHLLRGRARSRWRRWRECATERSR